MKKFISLIFFLFALSEIFGQRLSITLTFSAINNLDWVQLDSIKVMNRTQGGDTVLYYPDTVLVLDYQVGMPEPHKTVEGFQVFRNYPNPVADQTTINLYVPIKDNVSLTVTDILGRVVIQSDCLLDKGFHTFRFIPGDGSLFFFTAQWKGRSFSCKILTTQRFSYRSSALIYVGDEVSTQPPLKSTKDIQIFSFGIGDTLLYIGYRNTVQSGLLDSPEANKSYIFQFATNIPCSGTPTVTYDGQIYNTIQIFSQCWLKENLNTGTLIQDNVEMTDNNILEKYCYLNNPTNCNVYGGLYQWNEMMQYTTQKSSQGICPSGWHLPSDEEWKILEGAIDSQYGIGDPEWDLFWEYRGYDVGTNLKTTSGWTDGIIGTDLFGFSGQPGGYRYSGGGFYDVGENGGWWTSSEEIGNDAWYRLLYSGFTGIDRTDDDKKYGFSARCLKDD